MGQAGIFSEDDRVELIQEEIVVMTPIGSPHAGTTVFLNRWFSSRVGDRALVTVQNPVTLSPDSEPQPDVALLRPRGDYYRRSHPRPEDVCRLIEVADTSLEYDRAVRVPRYARAGIPEARVVDLMAGSVEVSQQPSAEG